MDTSLRGRRRGRLVLVALAAGASLMALGAALAGPDELSRRADDLYQQRGTPGRAESAIQTYQKALALEPGRSAPYWKIARTYFWMAGTRHGREAEETFKEAIEYAKLCVQVDDRDAGCHFWLGASYGKYGEVRGVFQSLYLVPYVRAEMARVLELDPGFARGSAYIALGRMEYLIPEALPGDVHGDKRKAREYLRKAAEVAPGNILARLWYGQALADAGDKEAARRELQAALRCDPPEDPVPEESSAKAEATRLLERL